MRSTGGAALWMGSAFATALGLTAVVLAVLGADHRGIAIALQVTARLSFLLFWPAYAGSAMVALFGPMFQPLKRYGRELGLAFASALFVHLGLVAWLCQTGATPAASTFMIFVPAVVLAYSLTLLSIERLQQAVGRKGWSLLRTVGLNYIAFAFARDFLSDPFHADIKHVVAYLPFATLAIAGPILCLAAFALRTGHVWRLSFHRAG